MIFLEKISRKSGFQLSTFQRVTSLIKIAQNFMQQLLPNIESINTLQNRTVFFYFLKLKNAEDGGELIKQQFAQHQARCSHWWNCEYTFIGAGEDFWTHAAIIEFPNFAAVENAIKNKIKSEGVEHLQVFAVRKTMPPKFILSVFKLLRPFAYFFNKSAGRLSVNNVLASFKTEGGIAPSKKQVTRHLANTRTSKAFMINLLQTYPQANYADHESGVSGATAYYKRYGFVAMRSVIMTGGNLVLAGRMGKPILETNAPEATKGSWEGIGIMEYSNPLKIFSLEKMPGYKKALAHRTAGLERTALIISKQ